MSDFFISKPIDVATRETTTFVSSRLASGAELIEVGCGDGEVAAQLLSQGFRVIGLDSEKDRVAKAQACGVHAVVASWPEFKYKPVDAIVFTRSLHHISPLDQAVTKARDLLKPDGHLLIEDFAFGETDTLTISWFVDLLRSEQALSLIQPKEDQLVTKLLSANEPVRVWHETHDQALHSIAAIIRAVSSQFNIIATQSAPYLYRYLVPVLREDLEAARFVELVTNEEIAAAKRNAIALLGRRIIAQPK
jgi:SAM-dependent methyltransferase